MPHQVPHEDAESDGEHRPRDQHHKKPHKSPSDGPTNPNVPPSPEGQHDSCKHHRDALDYIKLLMEGLGLVGLFAYTTFAALQWCANKDAADAAKSAADTAQKTLNQSVYSNHVDQRAWVSVLDIVPEKQDPLAVKIVFMNTGKTPARNFAIAASGDIGGGKGNESRLPGSGVIAPGGKYSSFVRGNGSLPQSTKLTIHGRIDYFSIFGGEHWTTFCYRLIHGKAGTPNGFSPCEYGNETDNNTAQ